MPTSAFSTTLEGWETTNGTETYVSTGGNPGGNLRGTEGGSGVWYFSAPAAFLGDQSDYYGGSLSFDLKQDIATSQFDDIDVMLTGGGLTLVLDVGDNPGTDWTSYSVNLALGGGWRIGSLSGSVASEAQIQTVLSDLEKLWIRGEYVNGTTGDASNLDNVALDEKPASPPAYIGAQVSSDFATGIDGWSFIADVKEFDWIATGGNPGGYLEAVDYAYGDVWYFVAPSKFLGDKSAYSGGKLDFDLKQSPTDSQFNDEDIVITGGGKTIVFDTASNPGTDWTHYSVTLDTTSDWRLDKLGGTVATQADIDAVLANVTALRIRGEFVSGGDTGGLDNVVLTPKDAAVRVLGDATLGKLVSNHDTLADALAHTDPGNVVQIDKASAVSQAFYDVTDNGLTVASALDLDTTLKLQAVNSLTLSGRHGIDVNGNGLANTIIGSDGANTLKGFAGRDRLSGGDGDDTLFGGTKRDILNGGDGDDTLSGDAGNDLLKGASGNDVLDGGLGNDTLRGLAGRDRLNGGDHSDRLYGGGKRDFLLGEDGNDFLHGEAGNDVLKGGKGRDVLVGGAGNDLLVGNGGADTFVFDDMIGADRIRGFAATNDAEKIDLSQVTAITDYTDLVDNHMAQVGVDVVITAAPGETITLLGVDIDDLGQGDFLF